MESYQPVIMSEHFLIPIINKDKPKTRKRDTKNQSTNRVFTCKYCDSEYTQKTNLYRHIRRLHKKKGNLAIKSEEKPLDKYVCGICQEEFSTKSLQTFHQILLHPKRSKGKRVIICPICSFSGSKGQLLSHYVAQHNVKIVIEEHNFKTTADFNFWKSNVERDTCSQYAKRQKHHVLANGAVIDILYCHRDGFYRPEGKNIRSVKVKGTNKINSYCPAFMRVMTYTDDHVSVLFLKTHFGHDYEVDRLTLTREDRDSIAEKIALGKSFDDILAELQTSKYERLRILNKKDLYNIEFSYNLSSLRIRNSKFDNVLVQHTAALKIPRNSVTIENGQWKVKSSSKPGVTETVEFINSQCDYNECSLKCKLCECCAHNYICTCGDQTALTTMCKHKHVVHLISKNPQIIVQSGSLNDSGCELESDVLVNDHQIIDSSMNAITSVANDLGSSIMLDNSPLTALVIQNLPNDAAAMFVPTSNINARKSAIRHQIAEILQAVESSEIEEELQLIETLLEPVSQTVQSMKESSGLLQTEVVQPVCKQLRLDDEPAQYFTTTGVNCAAQIVTASQLQPTVLDEHNNPILIAYTLDQPSQ